MKHILFDLDGTLTDSGEGIIHCGQETLAHFGLKIPKYDDLCPMVGPPLRDSLLHFGIRQEQMEEAVEVYRKNYVHHGQFENFPYPGAGELLKRLCVDGCQLYVATSKPEIMAVEVLQRFRMDSYFQIICGSTLDGSRITKAEVIAHLLKCIPANEPILMVGDTIYDIVGASELGLPSVGVAWGYGNLEQMEQAGALAIVNSMEELYCTIHRF